MINKSSIVFKVFHFLGCESWGLWSGSFGCALQSWWSSFYKSNTGKYKYYQNANEPFLTYINLGGCCGWQKCLPDVPAMSWRSSFLCQNKTEVTGAKCASSLQANRLCCSWSTLQRNRATGSQIKKVCLHWWVKVGTFYFMFLSNTKNACVYLRQL